MMGLMGLMGLRKSLMACADDVCLLRQSPQRQPLGFAACLSKKLFTFHYSFFTFYFFIAPRIRLLIPPSSVTVGG